MVSKAREDLPEPLRPVITVRLLRGISTSIFFRLCWRAPCTVIRSSIEILRMAADLYIVARLVRFRKLRYNDLLMHACKQCGGHLHRIHRTFMERFTFLAIYECRECKDISSVPRHFRYHLGQYPRCPKCGTVRITKLKQRDPIDPFSKGLFNFLERICGGGLYHCRFCRLQFYDRRKSMAGKPQAQPAESRDLATPAE